MMRDGRETSISSQSGYIRNECICVERYESGNALHWEHLPNLAVLVAESGMGTLSINGRKFALTAGSCYYALPDMPIEIEPYFNEIAIIAVFFERLSGRECDGDTICYTREYGGFADWGQLQAPASDRLLELAGDMLRASKRSGELAAAERDRAFYEWMYELTAANARLAGREYGNDEAIGRVIRYVDLHYHEELNRNALAQMAGFSPEYFSLLFKQVSGRTFTDYVTALRIRHIQERLLFAGAKLSDVAREVGYKDQYYVSRRFKQEVGVSPTQYARAPKRIVSLNPHLTMQLITLGIMPAATTAFPWRFAEYDAALRGAGCIVRDWTADFKNKELAELRPELIVAIDNIEQSRLRHCRSLAPVLIMPWYKGDWRSHLHTLAQATRSGERAEEWLRQYGERLGAARLALRRAGWLERTATIVNIRAHSAFIYLNRGMGSQVVYGELGIAAPDSVHRATAEHASVAVDPADVMPQYRADHMIVIAEPTALALERTEAMLASEPWISYRANGGNVHRAEMCRWHGYDPLSIERQLSDVCSWLQ